MGTVACVALAASSVGARTLPAQALTKIGATSAGTPVMLEAKSVKRDKGIITATFRVGLEPPIKTAKGPMVSLRSIMMLDCAKQTAATKERWFSYDAKGTKIARHDVPGIPGFGPAIKGSLPDAALQHFCTAGAK
jgi:hypothetical protein